MNERAAFPASDMGLQPQDYDVPADYRHWVGDRAENHIGPFFYYVDGETIRTAFRAQQHNRNAHDSVHGGVLMAFADYTLCLCANGGEYQSVATISCNAEFVAPALVGELILGEGETVRRGRSIVFSRCRLLVDERVVMLASAVIKRLDR